MTRGGTLTLKFGCICAAALVFFTSAAEGDSASVCKVKYPSDDGIDWDCRLLRPGDTPESVFGKNWPDALRFNRMDRLHFRDGTEVKVPRDPGEIENFSPLPALYPAAILEGKFILVDQSEQFLGGYEHGRLIFSFPVSVGEKGFRTPSGEFRITGHHRRHVSSRYTIREGVKYPMPYALKFHRNRRGTNYWIHGRDLPGIPVSHGCIGLYDEAMQKEYYAKPEDPLLDDARKLYEWVVGTEADDGEYHDLRKGPKLLIRGKPPL